MEIYQQFSAETACSVSESQLLIFLALALTVADQLLLGKPC